MHHRTLATQLLAAFFLTLPSVFRGAWGGQALVQDASHSRLSSNELGSPIQLFFDRDRKQMVLLSASERELRPMLWELAGDSWKPIPAQGLPPRELTAAAYDTRRKRLIVYGGIAPNSDGQRLADTWEWDGRRWHGPLGGGPGPRSHHVMVYDEARGVVVLFGGGPSDGTLDGDTWEWNGSRWSRAAMSGPGTRAHFAMAYDPLGKRTVLYGGFDERFRYASDTWTWDGTSWERLASNGPPARSHHAMAYDASAKGIVVFGGLRNGRPADSLADTWMLTGGVWRQLESSGPAERNGHVMEYDPARKGTLLHGGGSYDGRSATTHGDTWVLSDGVWSRVP